MVWDATHWQGGHLLKHCGWRFGKGRFRGCNTVTALWEKQFTHGGFMWVLTHGSVHAGRTLRVERAEEKLCSTCGTASGVLHLVEKQTRQCLILCDVYIVHLNVCE